MCLFNAALNPTDQGVGGIAQWLERQIAIFARPAIICRSMVRIRLLPVSPFLFFSRVFSFFPVRLVVLSDQSQVKNEIRELFDFF